MPTGSLCNNKITHLSSPFLCAMLACFILHHQLHVPCLHSTMTTSPHFGCHLSVSPQYQHVAQLQQKTPCINFYLQVFLLQRISSIDMVQWVFQPVCRFMQNLPANLCQQRNFYLSKFHLPLQLPQPRRRLINTPALNVFSVPCGTHQVKSQPSIVVSTLFCINILPQAPHRLSLWALLIKNGSYYTVNKNKKVFSFCLNYHNNGLWGELDGHREKY